MGRRRGPDHWRGMVGPLAGNADAASQCILHRTAHRSASLGRVQIGIALRCRLTRRCCWQRATLASARPAQMTDSDEAALSTVEAVLAAYGDGRVELASTVAVMTAYEHNGWVWAYNPQGCARDEQAAFAALEAAYLEAIYALLPDGLLASRARSSLPEAGERGAAAVSANRRAAGDSALSRCTVPPHFVGCAAAERNVVATYRALLKAAEIAIIFLWLTNRPPSNRSRLKSALR